MFWATQLFMWLARSCLLNEFSAAVTAAGLHHDIRAVGVVLEHVLYPAKLTLYPFQTVHSEPVFFRGALLGFLAVLALAAVFVLHWYHLRCSLWILYTPMGYLSRGFKKYV